MTSGEEPAAAELRDVRVDLGGRTVLDAVSVAIKPGEFMAVLGSNGAGKTTLLRVLLGLIAPTSGQVLVGGHIPRLKRSDVGYCPQVRTLDKETPLCGRDLVGLSLDGHRWGLRTIPRRERDARIREALADVDALAFADAPVGELSGGEQQRLAIAAALLSRPHLLLLDEPLASLDVRSQREIVGLVDRLRRHARIAVLFVTHGINPLVGVIDRVCYLAGGQAVTGSVDEVIQSDVLSRLYQAPVEVFRAGGRIFVATDDEDVHV